MRISDWSSDVCSSDLVYCATGLSKRRTAVGSCCSNGTAIDRDGRLASIGKSPNTHIARTAEGQIIRSDAGNALARAIGIDLHTVGIEALGGDRAVVQGDGVAGLICISAPEGLDCMPRYTLRGNGQAIGSYYGFGSTDRCGQHLNAIRSELLATG